MGRAADGGWRALFGLPDLLGRILLPDRCHLCGEFLDPEDAERFICPACRRKFSADGAPACTVCGRPFESEQGGDHPCGDCLTDPPPFAAARYVSAYEGEMARAIKELKYSGRVELARPLGRLLNERLAAEPFPPRFDVVIPVPLHPSKVRRRGFNQAALLAAQAADRGPVTVDVLARIRNTRSQAGLNKKERLANVKGAFRVRQGADLEGRSVLLIDDVLTTGATVFECARTLKRAKAAEVYVATLSRVVGL